MAKSRREKTLADYVVIAISPVLIMALVGSLCFFLLELIYHGAFEDRMRWILFWFVFAIVLIARIAIEQGPGQAGVYGLVMAGAMALVTMRLVSDGILVAWGLLALVWWCSYQLTWDCTLIDEQADSSGEGLLQAAGLDSRGAAQTPPANGSLGKNAGGKSTEAAVTSADDEPEHAPWWQRVLGQSDERRSKPHAPGLWVLYFSLAALPLFGIGQVLLPRGDYLGRQYAFRCLAVYVAAALGLLLTTSFLGLRRYLRQRKLQMPLTMAASWLATGTCLIFVVLFFCLLIPRPNSQYSITDLVDRLDANARRQAAAFAPMKDGAGKGKGAPANKPPPKDKPQDPGQKPQDAKQPEKPPADKAAPKAAAGEKKADGAPPKNAPNKNAPEKNNTEKNNTERKPGEKGEPEKQGAEDPNGKPDEQPAQQQPVGQQDPKNPEADKHKKQDPAQADKRQNPPPQNPQQQPPKPQPQNNPAPPPPTPSSSNWLQTLAGLTKWIIYGLFALFLLYVLIRNWSQIMAALADFWNGLFGSGQSAADRARETDAAEPVVPDSFAAFDNPFTSGAAQRTSPKELASYTFEALQAWAYEQGRPRSRDQTPLEFAEMLSAAIPGMSKEVRAFVQLYTRIAYAGQAPPADCRDIVERLWRLLSATANSAS